jgi:hypothetical protein
VPVHDDRIVSGQIGTGIPVRSTANIQAAACVRCRPRPRQPWRLGDRRRRANWPPTLDLGAAAAAQSLARNPWVRRAVMRLAENSTLDLDPDGIRHMLDAPAPTGHELGMLITAARAAHALESVAAELRSASLRVPA